MRWILRQLFCRRGKHFTEIVNYDGGFLIECKNCGCVAHYKFYD